MDGCDGQGLAADTERRGGGEQAKPWEGGGELYLRHWETGKGTRSWWAAGRLVVIGPGWALYGPVLPGLSGFKLMTRGLLCKCDFV